MKGDPDKYIPKKDLIDGCYYYGKCRNAHIARWSAEKERFYHWRHKFAAVFIESIPCPEDEFNYDVFFAFAKLEAKPLDVEEITFEGK
ncbi:MAG: hypothetical protein C4555_03150 [Dehalococcoidia bacterium]|nr:MAG: hypothetical protein C4555_03150 [Dehalococcoidia bacterium]